MYIRVFWNLFVPILFELFFNAKSKKCNVPDYPVVYCEILLSKERYVLRCYFKIIMTRWLLTTMERKWDALSDGRFVRFTQGAAKRLRPSVRRTILY